MSTSKKDQKIRDTRDVASIFSVAAAEFSHASNALTDLTAVFEAILASTQSHTLAHRLAQMGERLAEEKDAKLIDLRDRYNASAERYSTIEIAHKTEGS